MVLAAVLAGLFCALPASAQSIAIVSGTGQLICQTCVTFAPMYVKVTDSNGNPLPGVTVNWAITAGGVGATLGSGPTTTTAYDGTTFNTYFLSGLSQYGSETLQYAQNTVTASTANAAVAFSLSQALYDVINPQYPAVSVNAPLGGLLQLLLEGQFLTGQAGATGTPIQVLVDATRGGGIANVSVQLGNYQSSPSVNCAESFGGELNTAHTDATGTATCTPVFSGSGTGRFYVLVGAGGTPPPQDPTTLPTGNFTIVALNLTVTPAQPGLIEVIQGNGQSAAPGQALAVPLEVEVDTASGTPVQGQTVNWTVTPVGAINFGGSTSTTTGANGQTSQTATFSGTASGNVQITATCPACTSIKTYTFTETAVPLVTVTGLSIVSGNNQTALVNATFGLPLVVQVNGSNGQPDTSATVQFSVTGPASLSSSSVSTNSSGQAQVSVTAGATTGSVTVTATVGSFSQTFNLTILPPGPTLTPSSFYNGADFQAGSISPCSIATIIAPGLAPGIQGVVTPGSLFGPLPYLLASDAVSFNGTSAPIFNVANVNGQQQITVQVPCGVAPASSVPVTVTVGSAPPATVNVPVLAASPGIFQTVMSDGVSRAVAVRPDGSFVSLTNPARRGEIIQAFATGLGVTSPTVGTNETAIPGTNAIVQGTLIMGVTNNASQGEGVRVSTAEVAPDLIGVFEIPFQVPADAATGNNVSFSIGVIPVGASAPIYSATAKLPIQ
jgi:uncharacterized protein (TIGR03437 family)